MAVTIPLSFLFTVICFLTSQYSVL